MRMGGRSYPPTTSASRSANDVGEVPHRAARGHALAPGGRWHEELDQNRARNNWPAEWVQPWWRLLCDMKCATGKQATRHALLRDHDGEAGAEPTPKRERPKRE
jgi:hypothetical protein